MKPAPADHESFITGDEAVEELRDFIAQISTRCPMGRSHLRCPFNIFGLLDPQAKHNLIQAMTIEACQHFFDLERECRASPNSSNGQSPKR